MRVRKPLAIVSCRPEQKPIIRQKAFSTHARIKYLVQQLGIDPLQYQREAKLRILFRELNTSI